MAIYDTMQFIKPDVQTYCIGQAASMAAVLLAAGAKGKRFSLPNSRILIHQPWVQGLGGQATDIDIHAREILRMRERLNQILAQHTGPAAEAYPGRHRAGLHHGRPSRARNTVLLTTSSGSGRKRSATAQSPARLTHGQKEPATARSSAARSATRTRTTSAS